MAKAIIKVDVRSRTLLLEVLQGQQQERRTHGGGAFSLNIDNNQRNIGYIILEWDSFKSLHRFLHSADAERMMSSWPIEEILEVLELRDIIEDIGAA